MNPTTVALAVFEFALTGVMSVMVIYLCYRMFIVTNSDYDAVEELKKDNKGVAVLLAALLVASGQIVKQGIFPVMNLVRMHFTTPLLELSGFQVSLVALGHVVLVFIVAVFTLSWSLRMWGRLTTRIREGQELQRGNTSVGIVLAGVVLVMSSFMSDGVSRLTKSLIPQPSMGQVEIQR